MCFKFIIMEVILVDLNKITQSPAFMVCVWGLLFAALYFFMIRPQNKKRKEEEELRNSLEIGDEVTTIGGIVGRIVSIREGTDTLVIETGSEKNKLSIKKWAIASKVSNESVVKVK